MTNRASAVEAISPAFARTKKLLFQPFRFGLWARLAVVALVTGKLEEWRGGGSLPNLNTHTGQGGTISWELLGWGARLISEPGWDQIQTLSRVDRAGRGVGAGPDAVVDL